MTSQTLHQPLIHRLVPGTHKSLRTFLQILVGVAFVALLAQVRVQVGPVPLTGQTLGVLLLGAAYGTRLGAATLATYLLVGALGLPIFQGAASGWAYLMGSTGGYLVGFVLAAALVGALAERGWDKHVASAALAMLLGNLVIYAPGLLWLHRISPDWATTLQWGLTPFVLGDLLKLALAAGLLPTAWRLVGKKPR
ncbi:biotin transporter BioY [soil metagenome]